MLEQYTALVVDDEKVIRDGCSRLLAGENLKVLTAADGREAIDVLARDPVDVILCDLKMPVMGAVEVLENTSQLYPDIPVIIITGHGTIENAVECMKKGAYDFVTKPFRADHLILVTQRALEKRRLEWETRRLQEERVKNLYDLTTEQSRIKAVVNCMAEGVLVTNRSLEIVLHNPALVRLLELPPNVSGMISLASCFADEALCDTLRDLLSKQDKEEQYISQELTKGPTHLRALSALVRGPEREVLGTVTVFQDITTYKELNEMKSNFVHMVSHELRSPLAAIKQQHAVILDGLAGELTDKQRELLSRGQEKIQGLLDLINDLLDVAKIESGQHSVQQVPVRLDKILEDTVKLLTAKAEAQNVVLRLRSGADLPLILADARNMEEVFINLISNAINYSPDGGEVVVESVSHGEYVEVRVIDSGVGIEPEELPKIFDKFYRVKHPKTRKVIGTGLGLAIVKGIIETHRGSIEVESEPNVGSTFRVLLPAAVEEGDSRQHARE